MYERHFGLTGLPFGAAPDPDFYFDSRSHRRALGYLEYATLDGESLVLMTGEIGAGKTLLVRKLLAGLDPRSFLVLQLGGARLDARELPRAVLRSFGSAAPPQGVPDGPQAELDARLAALAAGGRRALLVVDEAQDLSADAVAWLAGLARRPYAGGPPLQLLLVGQPELRAMLEDAPVGPGLPVLLHCHVGPLAAGETRAYVEHRLRRVGWRGTPAFDAEAHERIHEATGGVPRLVNRLCDRLLLAACAQDTRAISAELVEQMDAELRGELGEAPVATVPAAQAARMHFAPPRPARPGEAVAASGRAAAPAPDLSLVIPTLVSAVEDEAAASAPTATKRDTPPAGARDMPPAAARDAAPAAMRDAPLAATPAADAREAPPTAAGPDTPPPAAARAAAAAAATPVMADSEPPVGHDEDAPTPALHAAAESPVPTVRIAAVAVAAGLAVVSLIGWWFYEANRETAPAAVAGRAPVADAARADGAASGTTSVAATADLVTQPPAAGMPAIAATAAASEPAAEAAREATAAEAAPPAEGATARSAETPAARAAETPAARPAESVSARPRARPRGETRARPAPAEEAARAAPQTQPQPQSPPAPTTPPEPAAPAAPCTPAVAALGLCPSPRPSD